ncbi:uncharacterized protein LOC144306121 isoform X3 [Canis aureus]
MCCKERTRRDYAEGELRWTMNARSTQSWWFAEGSRCLYWFNTEVLTSSHQNKKNKSDNLNKSPTELFQMFQTGSFHQPIWDAYLFSQWGLLLACLGANERVRKCHVAA